MIPRIEQAGVRVEALSVKEWREEGTRRFGPDATKWRFVCPVCGRPTYVREWIDADATDQAAFSCIGRVRTTIGCRYAGGGLFRLNPVPVIDFDGTIFRVFAFAPPQEPAAFSEGGA